LRIFNSTYCYITGGNGVTAVLINDELYFLRRDVQGTITGLVNQNDTVVEEYSYDACLSRCSREGRRRNPTNWTYDSVPQPQYMHRGYTMHEMLDEFGLINMNGRCYDPVVGRFLSPDIIVQNPNNTQCYNRYSYAINNPMKYSDPSGWSYETLDQWHDNAQRAASLEMQMAGKRLWREMNLMPVRGIRNLIGGNRLQMGGNADGENWGTIGDIVEMLKMLKKTGLAGLLGNPGDEDTGIDEQPGAENTKPPTVVNNSDSWSYVLTDDNKNYRIDAIPPGGKYFEKIDGVGTCLFDKFVFKAPSGAPITINSDCSVSIEGWESILDGFYYGWKDIYYFNDYDLNTNGWGDLFTALEVY